jgi:hypothetical protein
VTEQSSVEIVRRALTDLEALPDLLADDLVWHFAGDVEGIAREHRGKATVFAEFWGKLFEISDGTFAVEPLAIWPAGSELVVSHLRISMTIDGVSRSGDGVVVYRVVDGLITEAFDVPGSELLEA